MWNIFENPTQFENSPNLWDIFVKLKKNNNYEKRSLIDGPDIMYLELRDARDIGGNVTFEINREGCAKAEAIDACTT